jgi:hypothetical protein
MIRFKKVPNLIYPIFIVIWTLYFGIIWINAIQVRDDGWYSAYLPHWGDGAAHLSYMSSFAYRQVFPQYHPLYMFHPFTYSFAADMIGGIITHLGIPLWFAYNLVGFVLSVMTIMLLWHLMMAITKSSKQAVISITLFLTSGGLGFKFLILDKLYPASVPESPYLPLWLTQRESTNIVWLNTIIGELVPQRAFILAIPIGALLLSIWYKRFIRQQKINPVTLFLSGILFGCMPVIHPHTTMVLALTIVVWGLPELFKSQFKKTLIDLSLIAIPTLILGVFLTTQFLSPSVSDGFFKWYPGWLAKSKSVNWFLFWFDNWGLFLPLAIIGTGLINNTLKRVILPFWAWFILANLFLFQPYDWDNSKILTWVYLFLAIPVTVVLAYLWRKSTFSKMVAVVFFVILSLSGGVDAARMLDTKTYAIQLLNADELKLGEIVRNQTPKESIILTSTTHRNWVSILTGRQILCGYLGWMWTYGIKADDRVTDIRYIYDGNLMTEKLLKQYGINYVVIGPEERSEFHPRESYFSTRYPLLTKVGSTTIYKITP